MPTEQEKNWGSKAFNLCSDLHTKTDKLYEILTDGSLAEIKEALKDMAEDLNYIQTLARKNEHGRL